jgi:hypothetical protein
MCTIYWEGNGWSSRKGMGDGKINGSVSGGCGGAEEKEEGSRI